MRTFTMPNARRALTAALVAMSVSFSAMAADKKEPTAADKIARSGTGSACVFSNSIHDWQMLDDTNLVIWAPSNRTAYLVRVTMPLFGARGAMRLAFIDGNNDGRICSYGMDAIGVNDSSIPQKTSISSMTKLDAESIAQLEEQYKTKLSRERKKKIPKEPSAESSK